MAFLEEVSYIGSAMSYLRKYWFPQTGQGSQSEELDYNLALIRGMNAHIKARKKQFAEWRKEEKIWTKKYKAEQAAKKKAEKKE